MRAMNKKNKMMALRTENKVGSRTLHFVKNLNFTSHALTHLYSCQRCSPGAARAYPHHKRTP